MSPGDRYMAEKALMLALAMAVIGDLQVDGVDVIVDLTASR